MIELLSKLFIKDYKNYGDITVRGKYGVLCSVVAIVLNILLAVAKFIVGTLSGSMSITADAVNNFTDAGSSLLSFVGFKFADKKPDPEHPFGHGRIEYVMGMIIAGIILIAGFETFKESGLSVIERIKYWINPENPCPEAATFSWVAVGVLVASILVKFYMAYFMKKIGNRIDSTVMRATSADAMGDTVSTFAALLCLLINKFFSLDLDAFAGLFVSFAVMKAGISAAKETLEKLLGTKPSPELVNSIKETVMEFPSVLGVHDMVIHDYGPGRFFVSLHAEFDGNENIYKLHETTDLIMLKLNAKFSCESIVHLDPIDTKDELNMAFREIVTRTVKELSEDLDCHDIRVVPGQNMTNVIFDMLVPFDFEMSNDAIKEKISQMIKKDHPECNCAITIDRPYL